MKLKRCLLKTAPLFQVFLLVLSSAVFAAEQGNYVGSKTCSSCHEVVAADWQKSRHARAFESLKKTNQENLPGCVGCHVTGYGQPGGYIDQELTPNFKGVQCEECHGPGKRHTASPRKDLIVPAPSIEICRRCHTTGQDPNFDFKKKVAAGHSGAVTVSVKQRARAWLTAVPDHLDFGAIDEGTPASTTVILQNTGNRDIVITDMRTN